MSDIDVDSAMKTVLGSVSDGESGERGEMNDCYRNDHFGLKVLPMPVFLNFDDLRISILNFQII